MQDNTCICCGQIIPEGRTVCPACEEAAKQKLNWHSSPSPTPGDTHPRGDCKGRSHFPQRAKK